MWIVTKEAAVGIVRTFMPYVWAWLLALLASVSQLNFLLGWIEDVPPEAFILGAGTVIYGAIRWIAEKAPIIGRLLVFNVKPTYDGI